MTPEEIQVEAKRLADEVDFLAVLDQMGGLATNPVEMPKGWFGWAVNNLAGMESAQLIMCFVPKIEGVESADIPMIHRIFALIPETDDDETG